MDSPRQSFIPALLWARRSLVRDLRHEFDEAGFDDLPRTGLLYLSHLEEGALPLSQLIAATEISKQRASQVVDALVTRGYAVRTTDPDDRRRVTVSLTPRGHAAFEVGHEAVLARVDALVAREGAERVTTALAVLTTFADLDTLNEGES